MPNTALDVRVRAAFRARATAAAVALGAQIFATGTGLGVTLSLNAAYLGAMPCLLLGVIIAAAARRHLAKSLGKDGAAACRGEACRPGARGMAERTASSGAVRLGILRAMLCLLLLSCSALLLSATAVFASQILLPQAKVFSVVALTFAAAVICALSGGTGIARLAFAMRFVLPLGLAVFTLQALSPDFLAGLFPWLGTGARPLALCALCLLGASAPVALLFLPPPECADACALPGAWFFIWRVLLGGACGVLMLLAVSLCNTYETLAGLRVWGERMHIVSSSQPREGITHMLLALAQLAALFIGGVSTLCAAEQAACCALPVLHRGRVGLALCLLVLFIVLWLLTRWGMDWAFRAAPVLALPLCAVLLLSLWLPGRRARGG